MKKPTGRPPVWQRIALALVGALIGATAVLAFSTSFEDGNLFILLVAGLLLVLLPLNGLAVRRALLRGAHTHTPSRGTLYVSTALLWAAIAAVGLAGAALPNDWVRLDPLVAPITLEVVIGFGLALLAPALSAFWSRDLDRNGRKRARLRRMYRGGLRAVAPRTAQELALFRAASILSSAGEEVAYRLVLLQLLVSVLGPVGAALGSSIAFAFGHVYQGVSAAAFTGLFGLAAAGMTLWTGSIWPAIVFHVAWNFVAAGSLYAVFRVRRRGLTQDVRSIE